jgi:hypothetical protein
MTAPTLRLDWCSREAAKYAAEHWHYSGTLSSAKNVYIGVWEGGVFIGAIVFGIGAGNVTNGARYGLARSCQMAELTRIALTAHVVPVSRVLAVAVRMIRKQSPNIRLLVSMADIRHGHHGGVYQASGWIYTGTTKPDVEYFHLGAWRHHRTVTSARSAAGLPSRPLPPKYRYLLPLDAEMRARIAPLAKPYPKRAESIVADAPLDQSGEGGSVPTSALHIASVRP